MGRAREAGRQGVSTRYIGVPGRIQGPRVSESATKNRSRNIGISPQP